MRVQVGLNGAYCSLFKTYANGAIYDVAYGEWRIGRVCKAHDKWSARIYDNGTYRQISGGHSTRREAVAEGVIVNMAGMDN